MNSFFLALWGLGQALACSVVLCLLGFSFLANLCWPRWAGPRPGRGLLSGARRRWRTPRPASRVCPSRSPSTTRSRSGSRPRVISTDLPRPRVISRDLPPTSSNLPRSRPISTDLPPISSDLPRSRAVAYTQHTTQRVRHYNSTAQFLRRTCTYRL